MEVRNDSLKSVAMHHGGEFAVSDFSDLYNNFGSNDNSSTEAGSLLTLGIDGGSMLYLDPDNEDSFEYDRKIKDTCCGLAQRCHSYYRRRPADKCTKYDPPERSKLLLMHSAGCIGRHGSASYVEMARKQMAATM